MSLKAFHILFIILATILVAWFGIWQWERSILLSLVSFLVSLGLIGYGIKVFKKLNELS